MDIKHINFPVVTFNKESIYFARNENDLVICNKRGFDNGFFNELTIIDAEGVKVKVSKAKAIGNVGPFWGYNLFLERKIKVELVFQDALEKIELQHFKEIILKLFARDKYFWDADGLKDSRLYFIKKASSIREIISELTMQFYKEYK